MMSEIVDGYKLIICKKIDKYLTETKMLNKDFGEIFGVSEANVRHWRKGNTSLNINQIVKLCEQWNITLYELLDIKDPLNLSEIDIERLRKLRENPDLANVVDNYSRKQALAYFFIS